MSAAPLEPGRRARREARSHQAVPGGVTEAPEQTRPQHSSDGRRIAGGVPGASGFVGTWRPLVVAGVALGVAIAVGALASVAFDGAAGRSVGSAFAAVLVGATGVALASRTRPAGFFALRALDVLWALVAGAVLPFIAGVFAGVEGFPALAALSPRWLLLGVAAPFVVVLGLTLFAVALVFPAAESYAAAFLPPVWSRIVAGAVSSVAFAVIPAVFPSTVSAMPLALLIGLGVAVSVFAGLARRIWGPLLMSLVFTSVWVGLTVAGYALA